MIENLYEDLSVHLYEGEPITKKAPTPPPITYLIQWKIVGNSEVHGNEIWSCGEYNATDGKYHILVQPLGGSIADIALDEPLRKVNDVVDTIEFPSGTGGKALLTTRVEESGGELSPLDTPITELINVPQIQEANSYTCVIIPSSKTISWSDFITDKEQLYAYGVQWDITQTNPDVTRIGNMEYHALLPIQSQMRGCLLDDNGTVTKYLTQEDWNLSTLGDETHQVMIELPEFWWQFVKDGNTRKVLMSPVALNGYTRVPKMYVSAYEATIDRGNAEGTGAYSTWKLASVKSDSPRFRGGNNNSSKDDAYNTQLQMAATNISLTECRTYARRRKNNSTEWNLYTFKIHCILYWLFVVEYATRNSQKNVNTTLTAEGYRQGGLGNGITNANDSNWNSLFSYYPFVPIGISDSLGNGSGEVGYASKGSDGETIWCNTQSNRYRGVENPFGHIWKWVDGIHIQVESGESKVYTIDNPSLWQDSNNDNYNHIGNEKRENSYVKDVIFDDGNIICIDKQTSSDQYYCDYHYVNIPTAGFALRAVRFGGAAHNGAAAGFVYSATDSAPANNAARIGSRLCFVPNI